MREQTAVKSWMIMGVFTAVLAILSIIRIPMPSGVPVTLQTFAVALCGYVLGWKMGAITTALYMLMGTIGVPVFSGMTAGVGVLFGATGGFLWGFIVLAALCGIGMLLKNRGLALLMGGLGLVFCHICGIVQFSVIMNMGLAESAMMASIPYLMKDILSLTGALAAGTVLRKRLTAAGEMLYDRTV